LLRTAEGLGATEVVLSGYTPYPKSSDDKRLPHEAHKLHKQIQKTALGAESSQRWQHQADIGITVETLRQQGYTLAAIEQTSDSISLNTYAPPDKLALLVSREVEGIELDVLSMMDDILEIPMFGHKESFNVVQAAAMALNHCRFFPFM